MQFLKKFSLTVPSQEIQEPIRKVEKPLNVGKLKNELKESLKTISLINPEQDEIVMVLGMPGAGKSTVINYFLGWELDEDKNIKGAKFLDFKDSDKNKARLEECQFTVRESIKTKKKFIQFSTGDNKEFFEKKPILAKMESTFHAVTTMPAVYRSDGVKFAYCDCPGFSNTGAEDKEQEVAATLATVLAAKSGRVRAIIVLINGVSLEPGAGRGTQIRELFDFLLRFIKIGNEQIFENQNINIMESIFFVFNNIELDRDEIKYTLEEIGTDSKDPKTQKLFKNIIQDNNFHRVMIVNPKDGGESRTHIFKKIEFSPGIKPENFTFPTDSSSTLQQFEDEFLVPTAAKGYALLERAVSTIPVLIDDRRKRVAEYQESIKFHEKTLLLAQGYDLCLLSEDIKPDKGKFYIRKKDDFLEYLVFDPAGEKKNDKISKDEFEQITNEKFDQVTSEPILDNLKPCLPKILKITSERGHTVKIDEKADTDEYVKYLQNSVEINKVKITEFKENIWSKKEGYKLICLKSLPKPAELKKNYRNTYIFIADKEKVREYFFRSIFDLYRRNMLFPLYHSMHKSLIYYINNIGETQDIDIFGRDFRKKYEYLIESFEFLDNKSIEIKSDSDKSQIAWELIRSDGLHMKSPGLKYLDKRLSEINHEEPALYRSYPFQHSLTAWKWLFGIGFLMRHEQQVNINIGRSFIEHKVNMTSGVMLNPQGTSGSHPKVDKNTGTFEAKYITEKGESADYNIEFYIPSNEIKETTEEIKELEKHIQELKEEIKDMRDQRRKLKEYNKRLNSDIAGGKDRVSHAKTGIVEAEQEIEKLNKYIIQLKEKEKLTNNELEQFKEDFKLLSQIVERIEFTPRIIQTFYVMYKTYTYSAIDKQEKLEQKDHKYEHEQKTTLELTEDTQPNISTLQQLEFIMLEQLNVRRSIQNSDEERVQFLKGFLLTCQSEYNRLTNISDEKEQKINSDSQSMMSNSSLASTRNIRFIGSTHSSDSSFSNTYSSSSSSSSFTPVMSSSVPTDLFQRKFQPSISRDIKQTDEQLIGMANNVVAGLPPNEQIQHRQKISDFRRDRLKNPVRSGSQDIEKQEFANFILQLNEQRQQSKPHADYESIRSSLGVKNELRSSTSSFVHS